jgi:hypothetical protein
LYFVCHSNGKSQQSHHMSCFDRPVNPVRM